MLYQHFYFCSRLEGSLAYVDGDSWVTRTDVSDVIFSGNYVVCLLTCNDDQFDVR